MVEEVFTQVWSKPPFVVLLGADGCVIGAKSNITYRNVVFTRRKSALVNKK